MGNLIATPTFKNMKKCFNCERVHKNNNIGCQNSGYSNSGNWNSGYSNSGNSNSGYSNSGNSNSGNSNSGNWNSGNSNSGNWNSGIFNTDEPKLRAFNKECDLTFTEFRDKYGYKEFTLPLNTWIYKENMTDEEKKNINDWEQTGGYLKILSYKEAWQEGWKNATQEQKDWYKSLPNFDADIFLEITGIEVLSHDTTNCHEDKMGNCYHEDENYNFCPKCGYKLK